MDITVFGATGGIGRQLVAQALGEGHRVTAVVRDPARLTATGAALEVFRAGLDDSEALRPAVAGRHAVLSAVGPRRLKDAGIATCGTAAVLRAMDAEGVRRFLAVSAAPLGPVPEDETFFLKYVGTPLVSRVLRRHYDDLRGMEEEMRRSAADWTTVRPPQLTDKPLTGEYRRAVGANLRGGARISRADVAHAMLAMIDDVATVGQPVAVAY